MSGGRQRPGGLGSRLPTLKRSVQKVTTVRKTPSDTSTIESRIVASSSISLIPRPSLPNTSKASSVKTTKIVSNVSSTNRIPQPSTSGLGKAKILTAGPMYTKEERILVQNPKSRKNVALPVNTRSQVNKSTSVSSHNKAVPASYNMAPVKMRKEIRKVVDVDGGKRRTVETTIGPPTPERIFIPMNYNPRTTEGKQVQYSSPGQLKTRSKYEENMSEIMIMPPRGYKKITRYSPNKEELIVPQRDPNENQKVTNTSFLDGTQNWEETSNMDVLEEQVETELLSTYEKSPGKRLEATGVRNTLAVPTKILTEHGPVDATSEIISAKTVHRSLNKPEIVSHHIIGAEKIGPGTSFKSEIDVQQISPKLPKGKGKEVVHIISSVILAPNAKQVTKKVSYQRNQYTKAKFSNLPDSEEISKLVEEENRDINLTKRIIMPEVQALRPESYAIRRDVEIANLESYPVNMLEQSIESHFEGSQEPDPETIVKILTIEEQGLKINASPQNMFNLLFTNENQENGLDVSSIAPGPLQGVVVPISSPNQNLQDSIKLAEIEANIIASSEIKNCTEMPAVTFTENENAPSKSLNVARRGDEKKKRRRVPLISQEKPPWDLINYDDMQHILGTSRNESGIEVEGDEEGVIEYMLDVETPRHISRVQLRGSQKPSWFPGYFLSLPEISDLITTVRNADIAITAAWKAAHPDIFDENSDIIV